MGSSSVIYSDRGSQSALNTLAEERLRESTGSADWVCLSELLFYSPAMADRAARMVERHHAGVAVIYCQKSQFTTEKVVYRIRERWPRLYDKAYAFADWWKKKIGGGGAYGAPGMRGWLFRVPLFIAERVIGTAPDVRVEDAIDYTRQTIEALAKNEDLTIIVKMPKERSGTPKTEEQLARGRRFRDEIGAICRTRHIAFYMSEDARPTSKRRWLSKRAEDGIHSPRERREEQAADLSAQVLEAVRESAAVSV